MSNHKHEWDYYVCSMGYWKRCWGCGEIKPSTRKRVEQFFKETKL